MVRSKDLDMLVHDLSYGWAPILRQRPGRAVESHYRDQLQQRMLSDDDVSDRALLNKVSSNSP